MLSIYEPRTKTTNISFGQKVVSYLAQNANENDVTFLVGSEQTEVKALKLALKAACPALDKLFKEVWEKGLIHDDLRVPLPDLDPLAFRTFLEVLCWDDWDLEEIKKLDLKPQTIVHLVEMSKQLEMIQLQKVFSSLNRSYFSSSLVPHPSTSTSPIAKKEIKTEIQKSITSTSIKTERDLKVAGNVTINTSINSSQEPSVEEFHQIDSPTPYFTGRKDLLKRIHSRMQACSTKNIYRERIVVLSGLGGIGKTETARMYACIYIDEPIIKNVAWIDAESLTTLKESFISLAFKLKIPSNNVAVSVIVNCVYKHFSDHVGTGLFIFDNANQFNDTEFGIHEYLPNAFKLKRRPLILVTSRDTKWKIPKNNIIAVEELTEDESVELITKTLDLIKTDQTDKNIRQVRKLAQSLQGFSLGLCLAASNIDYRNEVSFKSDVKSYLTRKEKPTGGWIKDAQPGALTKYKLVMENVWDATLKKINRLDGGGDALKLLNLMAFFPTDGITVEAISDLFSFVFEKPVTEKEYQILENKSMLSITKVPSSLTISASTSRPVSHIKIHRLVQHSTREKLDARKDYSYLQHVCNYLGNRRLQDHEYYNTNAVLCAQEHLKNRVWPHDFIRYSVIFCSFMTFFEHETLKSTFQIFEDVYKFLGIEHMATDNLKTEKNAISLFCLCVLWKNTNIKETILDQSSFVTDRRLSAENFKNALLYFERPSSEIRILPKMELNILQRYLCHRCYQQLHNLYESCQNLYAASSTNNVHTPRLLQNQMRWSRKIEGFSKRWGHAAVALGTQIFSFGGKSKNGSSKSNSPMDIYVLNLDETKIRWKFIQLNPSPPSTLTFTPGQLSYHTAVAYKNNVIIFGGEDYKLNQLNSVCRFNTETLKWGILYVTGNFPEARLLHSAVAIQNKMMIFGGRSSSGYTLNDVHSLNMDSLVWSNITTIKGTPPFCRYGHSAVDYENRFIHIFGGYNGKTFFNDVICLDWNTKQWMHPKTSGTIPQPRCRHSAFMHKGLMYIYGGEIEHYSYVNDLFSYNPETGEWRKVEPIGEPPSPRTYFGCVALSDSVYIFGGTEDYFNGLDDTIVLDLE